MCLMSWPGQEKESEQQRERTRVHGGSLNPMQVTKWYCPSNPWLVLVRNFSMLPDPVINSPTSAWLSGMSPEATWGAITEAPFLSEIDELLSFVLEESSPKGIAVFGVCFTNHLTISANRVAGDSLMPLSDCLSVPERKSSHHSVNSITSLRAASSPTPSREEHIVSSCGSLCAPLSTSRSGQVCGSMYLSSSVSEP